MKKVISTVLLVLMSLSLVACGKNEDEKKEIIPQSSQMKSICELATMDCYYHNVAKYNEEDASGIWLWKKDRKFWQWIWIRRETPPVDSASIKSKRSRRHTIC